MNPPVMLLVQGLAVLVAGLLFLLFGAIIWDAIAQLWESWRNSGDGGR